MKKFLLLLVLINLSVFIGSAMLWEKLPIIMASLLFVNFFLKRDSWATGKLLRRKYPTLAVSIPIAMNLVAIGALALITTPVITFLFSLILSVYVIISEIKLKKTKITKEDREVFSFLIKE